MSRPAYRASLHAVATAPATSATNRGRRRIRVILNPNAGRKAGIPTNRTTEEQVRDAMLRHGLGDELIVTQSEAEAVHAARAAAAAGYDAVVAAGGDGTARVIAVELLRSRTTLGILPLGSAMNVARSLHIPRELDAAAGVLAAGTVRSMDVATANGRPFLEVGSVGINAAVFAEAARLDEGNYGSLFGMLAEALRFRPARMRITLDQGPAISTRALMIVVANAPYTGLGLPVAPGAKPDDGRLDVRVFSGISKLELFRYSILMLFGRHAHTPKIRTWRARRVRVDAHQARPVRADSLDLGVTPVEFAIEPGALRVIVPGD